MVSRNVLKKQLKDLKSKLLMYPNDDNYCNYLLNEIDKVNKLLKEKNN